MTFKYEESLGNRNEVIYYLIIDSSHPLIPELTKTGGWYTHSASLSPPAFKRCDFCLDACAYDRPWFQEYKGKEEYTLVNLGMNKEKAEEIAEHLFINYLKKRRNNYEKENAERSNISESQTC